MPDIRFYTQGINFFLKSKKIRKNWIVSVLTQNDIKNGQINYVFTQDKEIKKINQQFLQHDYTTDIISFELSKQPLLAEIYISIDTVLYNAKLHNCTFENELSRVMIHGVLHLCGFNDKTTSEQEEMSKQEDFWLNRLEGGT